MSFVSSVGLRLGFQVSLGLVEVSLGLVRITVTLGLDKTGICESNLFNDVCDKLSMLR